MVFNLPMLTFPFTRTPRFPLAYDSHRIRICWVASVILNNMGTIGITPGKDTNGNTETGLAQVAMALPFSHGSERLVAFSFRRPAAEGPLHLEGGRAPGRGDHQRHREARLGFLRFALETGRAAW